MSPASTLSESAAIPAGLHDAQAVAAVREGDTARYRELVERYQRRVYAVAWSRLGDATLAEEATQEAFIRAYRSLPLLGEGEKFSAWISAIARNLAISLGLRHRRELNKRARWALEQPTTEAPTVAEEPVCTAEMLRQTLAELPAMHRECLVLFYLEDKSGAEAAEVLGISEAALRVRLVRARAALREKLETRLGQSLEQLRPSSTLASSVMAVIAPVSPVKAAGGTGLSSAIMAALGKILPYKVVALFIPVVCLAPAIGLSWWAQREEQRNYRDPKGFRARLHEDFYRKALRLSAAGALCAFAIAKWVFPIWRTSGLSTTTGTNGLYLILGFFSLVMQMFSGRLLVINRSRYAMGLVVGGFCSTLGILAVGLGWIPTAMFPYTLLPGFLAMIPAMGSRPMRMDYSLFSRAAWAMLPRTKGDAPIAIHPAGLQRRELLVFAQFLGSRFMVINYRWADGGLQLCLPAIKLKRMQLSHEFNHANIFSLQWKQSSWIELRRDGTVGAHCSNRDQSSLRALDAPSLLRAPELETQVAAAAAAAWGHFRAGDLAAAERILGQVPEADIFRVPLAQAKSHRVRVGFMLIMLAVLVYFGAKAWRDHEAPGKNTAPVSSDVKASEPP